jgi:meso-butanediol dehydrogenase/(S,S)-butanediol dehydrogenase/diacetyl reductase
MSDEDWHYTIRNELDLVFFVTRAAWPYLTERGGVIINTASVAGWAGSKATGMVGHSATKGGVLGLTRQLAVEGAPHNIRAVSISPGAIATPATEAMFEVPEIADHLIAQNLLPRFGVANDIAPLAAYLASDEASFVTGADFVVDGGMLAT